MSAAESAPPPRRAAGELSPAKAPSSHKRPGARRRATLPPGSGFVLVLAFVGPTIGWVAALLRLPLAVAIAAMFLLVVGINSARRLPGTTSRRNGVTAVRMREQLNDVAAQRDDLADAIHATRARAEASAELVNRVEEEARATICAELHDTVTQTLVAAAFSTHNPDVTRDHLAAMMREAEKDLRHIMVHERPLPTNVTLVTLLERFVERTLERNGLYLQFTHDTPEHLLLPRYIRATAYRFVTEAVYNIIKHAGVDTAIVHLEVTDDLLTIRVHDSGNGYDPHSLTNTRGLALLHSRNEAVGGQLVIDSAPGHGTTLVQTIDLGPPSSRRGHTGS